jgi:two-component system NarL family response regulator
MSLCPRPESSGTALNTIRLLVAESHPAVRNGLVGLLNMIEGFEVAAEAADGWNAVAQFHSTNPDVILIGLHLPMLSCAEVIQRVRQEAPQTAVVVLSTYDFDEDIAGALAAGAQALLLAGVSKDELVTTIRRVHTVHRAPLLVGH